MTDERKSGNGDDRGIGRDDRTNGDPKSTKSKVRDGIKDGLGVLSAFKDALEETINEARERGDLSADRAKEVMKDTLDKAQTAAEGARDRLDFATQAEVEAVKTALDSVKERVSELEASVFGVARDGEPPTDAAASGPAGDSEPAGETER